MGMPAQWMPEGDKWRYWDGGKFVIADWVQSKGYWYYMGEDGNMVTGWKTLDGITYYFKTKAEDTKNDGHYGHMIADRWCKIDEKWHYFDSNGAMVTSKVIPWKGKKYYVGDDGVMAENEDVTDKDTGTEYWADANGVLGDNGGYGNYTEEDYNYLVALGGENNTYDGFLAVAYCVLNIAKRDKKPIRTIVSNKNLFQGFNASEIGNPRNEDVKNAVLAALRGSMKWKKTCFILIMNMDIYIIKSRQKQMMQL